MTPSESGNFRYADAERCPDDKAHVWTSTGGWEWDDAKGEWYRASVCDRCVSAKCEFVCVHGAKGHGRRAPF